MRASTRRCERAPRGRARRLAPLLALAAGSLAAAGPREDIGHPLDLTDDLYHRVKAGLFVPDREPLVLRGTRLLRDGVEVAASGELFRFAWDQGSFEVATNELGAVVVHLDLEAALSHLSVTTPPTLHSMSREFRQFPEHPIR